MRMRRTLGKYFMRAVPARSAARYEHQLQVKPMMVGSNCSLMIIAPSCAHEFRLEVGHQEPIDLRQNLLVAKAGSADGACGAGRHTRAAALTQRGIDFTD